MPNPASQQSQPHASERQAGDRLLDLFTIWSVVAQAGVISRLELGRILRADPEVRARHGLAEGNTAVKRYNTRLSRDLVLLAGGVDRLEAAEEGKPELDGLRLLIRRVDHSGREWWRLGSALPGLFLGLRRRQRREPSSRSGRRGAPSDLFFMTDEKVPREVLASLPQPRDPFRARVMRSLAAFLAEAGGAIDPEAPSTDWLRRLERLFELHGAQEAPRGIVLQRQLVPSFERSRKRVKERLGDEEWDQLLEGIASQRKLRLTLTGNAQPLTLSPRRLVRHNGRFRLEGVVRRGGNRLQFVPLHRIRSLELTGEAVDPASFPSLEEDRLLAACWGLDAEDKLSDPALPLVDRIDRVVLRFYGNAIATIADEPGHPEVALARERAKGRQALRYEVETIVGAHFRRWVRMWGAEVEVLEPAWLREAFRVEAQAIAGMNAPE